MASTAPLHLELPRLNRTLFPERAVTPAGPAPVGRAPVRIVHLGLGNFHRAHQAWYTAHADDAASWGIAAFTGRRPDAANDLAPQDGLYTLIVRSADEDRFELIDSIVQVHPASEHQAFLGYLRRPEVAVVTITLTEAAYLRGPDGRLSVDNADVINDLHALEADSTAPVTTLPAKLVAGLAARRAAGAGPITILSCDNLPHNGAVTATIVADLAERLDSGRAQSTGLAERTGSADWTGLAEWISAEVDFATSMVDRITPATTDADRATVAEHQHYVDRSPVPTEPYSEWVISGRFPAGRPAWDTAGARLVDDVTRYEQRKLWLLNGSHSLLAYAGSLLGHTTIDEAVGDPRCRQWVESFWDEAAAHLPLPADEIKAYRTALLDRFANPRVRHQLRQIAADGSIKLPVRIIPSLRAEREAGRLPTGGATAIAAWIEHLRGHSCPIKDSGAAPFQAAAAGTDPVAGLLDLLHPGLSTDADLIDLVRRQLELLQTQAARP